MDIKIAITQANDEVAIMSFITVGRGNILPFGAGWVDERAGEWIRFATPENIENEIARSDFLAKPIKGWRIVSLSEIPKDRTYRNALRDVQGKLNHDMPIARELHREKIRHARAIKFVELDGEWTKAVGQYKGADVIDAIEAKRQKLRDMPNDHKIEEVTTTEELKALWPTEELGEI